MKVVILELIGLYGAMGIAFSAGGYMMAEREEAYPLLFVAAVFPIFFVKGKKKKGNYSDCETGG